MPDVTSTLWWLLLLLCLGVAFWVGVILVLVVIILNQTKDWR